MTEEQMAWRVESTKKIAPISAEWLEQAYAENTRLRAELLEAAKTLGKAADALKG